MSREHHVEGVISAAEMIRQDIFPFVDKDEVYRAALYHDYTKEKDQSLLVKEYGISDTALERSPAVIHAFTAAEYLKRQGEKEAVVNAVRYHTTGRPNMTDIEKIIFVADYIEENREYETCKNARNEYLKEEKTPQQLDKLIYKILKNTVDHLAEKKAEIYPLTLETMEWYENDKRETINFGRFLLRAKINHNFSFLVHFTRRYYMAELQDKIAAVAKAALDSKNGQDISAIHVAKQTVLADWFVLATGTSNTHINALADEVEFKVKEELGVSPIRTEGMGNNMWILIDYGSVIVHVFTKEGREFYKLDKLWNDVK